MSIRPRTTLWRVFLTGRGIPLEAHRADIRPYLYTYGQLAKSLTHDSLWNAAQLQLVREGTMHGYMRMYWGKKILEWSTSPEEALARLYV